MYERILVPLKHHAYDDGAIEHASAIAGLTGGRLILLHVVHAHSRDEAAYVEEEAGGYLQTRVDQLAAQGVQSEARVVQGEPAETINRVADEIGADLVVMATHGHSELRHVFAGSVTEDVVRNGDVPVLLVRRPGD